MTTFGSRYVAVALMLLSSAALIVLGIIIAVSNRVTGPEALAGFAAIMAAAGSGLWLRWHQRGPA